MSSVPQPPGAPPPVPPPPPPPGMPGSYAGIPWEHRQQIGFAEALVETVKLFIKEPAATWARVRPQGDLFEALTFSVLVSWVGVAASAVWSMLTPSPFIHFLPPALRDRMGAAMAGHMVGAVFQIVLAPVFIVIGLFIWAGLVHLSLMIVGGLSSSTSGFEGTFRAIAYSGVGDLAQVVPVVGGLIALVWKIILSVMGIVALHRTTTGKAVAGVLIPLAVCCVCVVIVVVVIAAGVAGAVSGFRH